MRFPENHNKSPAQQAPRPAAHHGNISAVSTVGRPASPAYYCRLPPWTVPVYTCTMSYICYNVVFVSAYPSMASSTSSCPQTGVPKVPRAPPDPFCAPSYFWRLRAPGRCPYIHVLCLIYVIMSFFFLRTLVWRHPLRALEERTRRTTRKRRRVRSCRAGEKKKPNGGRPASAISRSLILPAPPGNRASRRALEGRTRRTTRKRRRVSSCRAVGKKKVDIAPPIPGRSPYGMGGARTSRFHRLRGTHH